VSPDRISRLGEVSRSLVNAGSRAGRSRRVRVEEAARPGWYLRYVAPARSTEGERRAAGSGAPTSARAAQAPAGAGRSNVKAPGRAPGARARRGRVRARGARRVAAPPAVSSDARGSASRGSLCTGPRLGSTLGIQ
jgi:hypothetical protein